ncbi:MAG: hypothetical protein AAF518_26530 [Spirochaetota bacterium]
MRKYHIDYFTTLVAQIQTEVGGVATTPFVGKFFEVAPPLTSFKDTAPFCTIHHSTSINQIDSQYKVNKITSTTIDGKKVLRFLKKHFLQEYTYQLDFWLPIPSVESDYEPSKVNLIDQVLSYIVQNPNCINALDPVNDVNIEIRVTTGESGTMYEPEDYLDLYKTYIEITMRDGLFEILEEATLGGSTVDIGFANNSNNGT